MKCQKQGAICWQRQLTTIGGVKHFVLQYVYIYVYSKVQCAGKGTGDGMRSMKVKADMQQ